MDALMFMAEICHEYHWTYQEFINQPIWFIDLLKEKYRIDAKRQEKAFKK